MQSEASKHFVISNLKENVNRLRLKYHAKNDLPYKELIDQIEARQRLKKKNDLWLANPEILFPPKISQEQSSSDKTAEFKSEIVEGKSFIDATGGMGIDSYFLSRSIQSGVYCELDPYLCSLAAHNFKTLKANIIVKNTDGLKFINELKEPVDLIYLDPARREKGKKLVSLTDYQPNVPLHLDAILNKAKTVMIKASPMLDIKMASRELRKIKKVYVISVNNECKELLFILEKENNSEPFIEAVNITGNSIELLASSKSQFPIEYGKPLKYLYEPNASIMKANLFNEVSAKYALKKLPQLSFVYI